MPDDHQNSADLSKANDCLVDPAELLAEPNDDSKQSHQQYLKLRRQSRSHWVVLLSCAFVVALSFMLRVRQDERVEFRIWPDRPLPHTCTSRVVFGVNCPGCGLTRSFIFLAEGNLAASFGVHRLGWIVALFVLFQFPYRIVRIKWPERIPRGPGIPTSVVLVFSALLLGNWLIGFLT